MTRSTAGFLYYSVGSKYTELALRSIESLKHYMPQANTLVFSNDIQRLKSLSVKTVAVADTYDKSLRIRLLMQSPFTRTFYMDSDTLFTRACPELFDLLHNNELCLTPQKSQNTRTVSYNSGVLGYRLTDAVVAAFTDWELRVRQSLRSDPTSKDEPILQEILRTHPLKIAHLPKRYNFHVPSDSLQVKIPANTAIIHSHLF